jgi:hypothetical protein
MQRIKQGQPIAALRRIYFTAVDSTNLQSRQTALAGFGVRIVKAGVADAAGANAPVEVSAANLPGVYYYELSLAETNTAGPGVLRISKAGTETREIPFDIERAVMGTAAAGTLTASSFTTNLTISVADQHKDALVLFHTGALAGQVKKVGASAIAGGLITLASGYAFTGAPSNGDVLEILNR